MEMKVETAVDNINIIKETIEESRVSYKGIYIILIIFGFNNLLKYTLPVILFVFQKNTMIAIIFQNLISIILIIGCIKIYKSEKHYTNKFYLGFLNILITISIAIPLMSRIINTVGGLMHNLLNSMDTNTTENWNYNMGKESIIIIFIISMILIAYIVDKKYLIFIALMLLFVFFLFDTVFSNWAIDISRNHFVIGTLLISSIYNMLVLSGGYLFLGFYLKHHRRVINGD